MKKNIRYKKEDFIIPGEYLPQYGLGSFIKKLDPSKALKKFDDAVLGGQQSENAQAKQIADVTQAKTVADTAAQDKLIAAQKEISDKQLAATTSYNTGQLDLGKQQLAATQGYNKQQLAFQREQFNYQKQQTADAKADQESEQRRQMQLQGNAQLNSRTGEFYREGGVLGLIGNTHEEGGIMTNNGNPTSITGEQPTEEIENGEYIVQMNPQLSKALKDNLNTTDTELSGTTFDNGGKLDIPQGMDKYVLSKKNGTAKQYTSLKSKYKHRLNDDGTPNDVLSGVGYYNDLAKIVIDNERIKKGLNDGSLEFKKGGWIQKAVNPAHKGYCTPMTKKTCTPRRKAFAETMKKHHGFHEDGGNIYAEGGNITPEKIDRKQLAIEKLISKEANLKGVDVSNVDEQMPPYKFVNVGDANQQNINWYKQYSKGDKYDAAKEYKDRYLKNSKGKVVGFEGNDMYLYNMDKKSEKGDGVTRYALLPQVYADGGSVNHPFIKDVVINKDASGKPIPSGLDLKMTVKQHIKELEKDLRELRTIKPSDLKRVVDRYKTEGDYIRSGEPAQESQEKIMPIDPQMMGYNPNQQQPQMKCGGKLPKYDLGAALPFIIPGLSAAGSLASGFTGLYYQDKASKMIHDMPNQNQVGYEEEIDPKTGKPTGKYTDKFKYNIGYEDTLDAEGKPYKKFQYETSTPEAAKWDYKYQNIDPNANKVSGMNAFVSPELLDLSAGKQAIIDQNTQGIRGYSESIKDTLNPAQSQAANAVMRASAMKQAGQGISGLVTQENLSNQQARMQAKGMNLDVMKTNKQIESQNAAQAKQTEMFNKQMGMQSAKTGLDTQMYNIGTKLQSEQFNVGNKLKTDMFNTSNKFQADMYNSNAQYNSAMNKFNARLQNTQAKGQIINNMINGVFGAAASGVSNYMQGQQTQGWIDQLTKGSPGLGQQQSVAGANMGGDLGKYGDIYGDTWNSDPNTKA
jgi:hypothetical protein